MVAGIQLRNFDQSQSLQDQTFLVTSVIIVFGVLVCSLPNYCSNFVSQFISFFTEGGSELLLSHLGKQPLLFSKKITLFRANDKMFIEV